MFVPNNCVIGCVLTSHSSCQRRGSKSAVITLIVSSGCPAKTKQTPPKPPAKKFFSGLIGCGCLDIFTFRSAGRTNTQKTYRLNAPEKQNKLTEIKIKMSRMRSHLVDSGSVKCVMCCCCCFSIPEHGPFTHFSTRTC